MKKSLLLPIGALLIFLLAFGLRWHYLEQKQDAHVDEILSIVLSEYNHIGWGGKFETNKIFTPDELKRELMWNDPSIKGALGDIYKLWKNNRDDPHTNLYYTLFRIWHIGFDSTNLKEIFCRGVSLNFVFFAIGFFVAYLIARRLFDNKWFILTFLGVAFLNPASISDTMFMRPYAMQEMFFLVFCFFFIKACDRLMLDYEKYNTWKFRLIFAFFTAMLLLSGYFGVVFVLMIIGCATLWELKRFKPIKKFKTFFPLSFISAIVICFIFYPKYSRGFRGSRGAEASDKISFSYLQEHGLENLRSFFEIVGSNLSFVVLVLIGIGLLLSIFYRKYLKREDYIAIIFGLCAFVWSFAVICLAPYKTLRYIMSIFPILLLLLPLSLKMFSFMLKDLNLSELLRKICLAVLCVFCIYTAFPKTDSKIEFLDHGLLNSYNGFDMAVALIDTTWLYAVLIPYIESNMVFIDNCDDLQKYIDQYGEIAFINDSKFANNGQCKIDSFREIRHWNAGGFDLSLLRSR